MFDLKFYIDSQLSMEEYHSLADKAMEDLLAAMEDLIESRGEASQEVDYHVGGFWLSTELTYFTLVCCTEWCAYPQSGPFWNVCDQQAASKPTNMAIFTDEVRFSSYFNPFPC